MITLRQVFLMFVSFSLATASYGMDNNKKRTNNNNNNNDEDHIVENEFSKKQKYDISNLHIACLDNNFDMVKKLLKNPLYCKNINELNCDNNTALHCVCSFDVRDGVMDSRIVKILLKNGAHSNLKNEGGRTPLHIIVRKLRAILDSNEDVMPFINSFKDIIRQLLIKGANPNLEDNSKKTAYTETQGNIEIINLLDTYNTHTDYKVETVSLNSIANFFENLSLTNNNNNSK